MRPGTYDPVSRRRFAWLLWLALLMPLAQAAAAWHVVAHESARAGSDDGKHGPAHSQCELCLAAAALGSGAPPGKAAALPCPACVQEMPSADSGAAALAPAASAYRSRAPPSVRY